MSRNAVSPTTLQAAWPVDSLDALECGGRAAQRPWDEGMTPSHESAGGATDAGNRMLRLGLLVRADYERLHPEDSFGDLKRRARFSKEDKGVLRDWLLLADRRERARTIATAVAAERARRSGCTTRVIHDKF
jgi:hypothetical protein